MELQIIAKYLNCIRKGQDLKVAEETLKVSQPAVENMLPDGMEIKHNPEESRNIAVVYKYKGANNKRKRREVVIELRKYTISVDGVKFAVETL